MLLGKYVKTTLHYIYNFGRPTYQINASLWHPAVNG